VYISAGREFAGHGSVNHSIEEYMRGDFWHTNTVSVAILACTRTSTNSTLSVTLANSISDTTLAKSPTPSAPHRRSKPSPASASTIGGLVAGHNAERRYTGKEYLKAL